MDWKAFHERADKHHAEMRERLEAIRVQQEALQAHQREVLARVQGERAPRPQLVLIPGGKEDDDG